MSVLMGDVAAQGFQDEAGGNGQDIWFENDLDPENFDEIEKENLSNAFEPNKDVIINDMNQDFLDMLFL